MAAAGDVRPAVAQSLVLRGAAVHFATGDELNCPSGVGVTGGAELRAGRRIFGGIGADVFAATPSQCTFDARVVAYDGAHAEEFGGVNLLFAPRLSARLGALVSVGALQVEPSVAVGAIHAPELWGDGPRRVLPWTGVALVVRPRTWRAGLALEHGVQRVPVNHRIRFDGDWQDVRADGVWRRVTQLGVAWPLR